MAQERRLMKAAALLIAPAALAGVSNVAQAQVTVPSLPQDSQAPQNNGAELKLLTPQPGATVENGTFPLDISFQSRNESPVVKAELWVDGVKWASRPLEVPQLKNILSFDVDASTLTTGKHQFLIKVYSADGSVSHSRVEIRIAGFDSTSASGPEMKFHSLAEGQKVSGVVELMLDVKPKGGVNPYVTIYIDKQFKTLKNYPPYNYLWDTTTVTNGYHIVEAMGYTENANASTTRRMKVFVDNPGGATVAMKAVPDLDKKAQPAPLTKTVADAKPLEIPVPKAAKVETAKPVLPALPKIESPATVAAPDLEQSAPVTEIQTLGNFAHPVGNAMMVLPDSSKSVRKNAATVSAPRTGVLAMKSGSEAAPVVQTVSAAPQKASVVPVVPVNPVKATAAAPKAAVPMAKSSGSVKVTKSTPRAAVRPAGPSVMEMMKGGSAHFQPLQVAFDGSSIAFDVQPRVEAGLPLAPFRHIFEHSGGQVMWVAETKVVRAVSADREVVISVGKNTARVNGQNVSLDRAAFIDRGRTMVPLSFVGQALDVDVQYDPATGRVSITSKN
ncbi:MAG: hypothetical protein OHK0029_02850 [Armatimonadaceae bacterium]